MAGSVRDLVLSFRADTSDLKKGTQSIRSTMQKAWSDAGKTGQDLGGQFGAAVGAGATGVMKKGMGLAWTAAKTTAKVGAGAVAAVAGAALVKGFGRLTAIEDATARLKGLGYSAKDAANIIQGPVLKAVKGTAFGLDEAASAASGALGAGVKNGKELQRYLTLVGDAATQSNASFGDMALMMNKVQGGGKLTGDVLQQMAENGLQVMPMLVQAFHKPQAEIQKMVSQGKISSKQFQAILQRNIGGAAQKSGDTTSGAFKNMLAALSRIGASFLKSVFPFFKRVMNGITGLFDTLGPIAEKFGTQFGRFIKPVVGIFQGLMTQLSKSEGVNNAVKALAPFLDLIKQLAILIANIAKSVLPIFAAAFKFLLPIVSRVASILAGMIKYINDNIDVFKIAAVALGAIAVAMKLNALWGQRLALITKVQVIWYRAWTIAQAALNAVMDANPVMLIVLALIALGAALVIAYKKSETFRKFVNAMWAGIKTGAKAFAKFFTTIIPNAFRAVVGWIRKNWKKAVFLNPVTAAIYLLIKHRDRIKAIFRNLVNWIKGTFRKAWAGVRGVLSGPVSSARAAISNVFGRIRNAFNGVKNWVRDTWRKGWNNIRGWLVGPIQSARTAIANLFTGKRGLGSVFRNAVSTFGRIWSGLKGAIGRPLNAVINFINQGLIRNGINRILGALGVPKKQQIPWIPPVKYATGGPIRGRGTGTSDSNLIRASRDEHMWTAEEVRKFGGHRKMAAWRKAVRTGQAYDYPPGYAAGGVVRPVPGGFGRFPSYPGHTGVDFPVGMNTPVHAVMAGIIKTVRSLTTSYGRHIIQSLPIAGNYEALYAHLNSFNVRPGQHVGAGQVIAMSDDSGNSTGPHLHFTLQHPGGNYVDPTSFLNGGAAPAGGGGGVMGTVIGFLKGLDPVKWLTNRASSLKNTILGKIGSSPFAQGLANIPMVIIRKAASYLQNKLFGGVGQAEPAGSGVERWRGVIRTALGMNHLPTTDDYVNAWLRQVQSESGGNPRAVQHGYTDINTITGDLAKGLLQTISSTFNANKFPGHGDIFNGLDNALAAIRYAKSRYGAQGMLGVIGHGHGYDNGGWLPKGLSLALNRTGGPEPVLTGRQWSQLGSQPSVVINVNGALDPDAVASQIDRLLTRHNRLRTGVHLNRLQAVPNA